MTFHDPEATARTRARYERIAPFYNLMEILPEQRYIPWRKRLWELVEGPEILEVGVGTGKNMPFYPDGAHITGIDLTPGMLARAQKRAKESNFNLELRIGDVQNLDFPENTFDTVVATFVFCSVPDPVLGFREIKRVTKPGGKILLLEHMRANNAALGVLMDVMNPLVVRLTGANINRLTVENTLLAGLHLEEVEELGTNGIFKLLIARKNKDEIAQANL